MSESPDTQAEAVGDRCAYCGSAWPCLLHPGHPAMARTPSAEPDGEARLIQLSCGLCGKSIPNPGTVEHVCPAPAQDGAEVEALADLILDHRIEEGSRNLGQYRTEWVCSCGHKFITDGHQGESFRVKHAEHVAVLLAQRDKDRDVVVAAKVAEQIAQEVEAKYLGADCGRQYDGRESPDAALQNAYDEGLETAAAIARAAAPAGGERE